MSALSNKKGFRGYIGTRMVMGRSTPQHIQQMVMRDYCRQRDMAFLLGAVEYRMRGCTMILDALLANLERLEGIVMYSLYLFPESGEKRLRMYGQVIESGCTLHTACEGIVIRNWEDAMRVEDAIRLGELLGGQKPEDFNYLAEWELRHAAY